MFSTDHVWSQGPVLVGQVNQGEGHGEGAQKDVCDGQVGDEDVSCSQKNLKLYNVRKVTR